MIIDCNMNLPLLYWASEQTGDPRYAQAATAHAGQAANYIVREDASTYHTYYMDVQTGEPRFGNTHQGLQRYFMLVARPGVGHLRFPAELSAHRR